MSIQTALFLSNDTFSRAGHDDPGICTLYSIPVNVPSELSLFEYTTGDIAWVITASALVWLMLPGVGFFYSGLTGQKSALSMIMLSFIAMSVGAIQVRPASFSTSLNESGSYGATPSPSQKRLVCSSAI